MVTTHPRERAWAAWKNMRVRHQRCAGPGYTRRKTAPFSLFVHASDKGNGKRVETAPLSATANHAKNPHARRCERGPRGQRQKSGRGAEARRLEELLQCATLRKTRPLVPDHVQDPSRASPTRTGTRTRPGTTLEKALTRALTGSTLSVGRVFFCIFNAARPVDTILNGHGYAVLLLDPSRGLAFGVGQPGVASTVLEWLAAGRVWGQWSGTPSLNSAQRNSQALHVGRFLRACAALGNPAGEHSPLCSRLMQRWSGFLCRRGKNSRKCFHGGKKTLW